MNLFTWRMSTLLMWSNLSFEVRLNLTLDFDIASVLLHVLIRLTERKIQRDFSKRRSLPWNLMTD